MKEQETNMYDMILIRFGEMTLKGKNYKKFLKQLNSDIKNKLRHYPEVTIEMYKFRTYLYLNGTDETKVMEVLDQIPGIYSYSLCVKAKKEIDDIVEKIVMLIQDEPRSHRFKVETNRGDKTYPMSSIQISQAVAKKVLNQAQGFKVDVHNPTLVASIDFRTEGVYIYTKAIQAMGGFPSGSAGKGLLMLSGGIDSVVAGYLAIKKGLIVDGIHFYSPPHTSQMSLQKVYDLAERLSHYVAHETVKLYVVPFTKIQERLYKVIDEEYMITVMRRVMYKIADIVTFKYHYQCIINGESIGQVASQTLRSMSVVNEVTNKVILRPLAIFDKEEIVNIAHKIKTFDISIRPYDDCCTVFVPEQPVIKPNLGKAIKEETLAELDSLIQEAIETIEIVEIRMNQKKNVLETEESSSKFTL